MSSSTRAHALNTTARIIQSALRAELDRQRAEVERLTRERDDAEQRVRDIDALWHGQRDVIAERDQLRAEVERLRSAPHCPTCGCWR